MCVRMTGKSHTDPEAKPFALKVMQHMNDKCAEWRKAENISYSLYGTPMESTTYKFAKALQKRFGIIEGVTEWLPISSTGHMILLNEFVTLKVSEEFYSMFEVVIQLGAILAVVVIFWNKLWPFGRRNNETWLWDCRSRRYRYRLCQIWLMAS